MIQSARMRKLHVQLRNSSGHASSQSTCNLRRRSAPSRSTSRNTRDIRQTLGVSVEHGHAWSCVIVYMESKSSFRSRARSRASRCSAASIEAERCELASPVRTGSSPRGSAREVSGGSSGPAAAGAPAAPDGSGTAERSSRGDAVSWEGGRGKTGPAGAGNAVEDAAASCARLVAEGGLDGSGSVGWKGVGSGGCRSWRCTVVGRGGYTIAMLSGGNAAACGGWPTGSGGCPGSGG